MATESIVAAADNAGPKPKKPTTRHDALHDFDLFTCCWCMCARCWLPYPGNKGMCVCMDCPCDKSHLPLGRAVLPESEHRLVAKGGGQSMASFSYPLRSTSV